MFHRYCGAFRTYVTSIDLRWNKYQKENLVRLGAAFMWRRSLPLRRLARSLAGPSKDHRAPDKRFRRFLGNPLLDEQALDAATAAHLRFLLRRFGAVPFVLVAGDWTFIRGRAILWLQVPYRGRSLPLICSVHDLRVREDEEGRTEAEKALLLRLLALWPAAAPPPVFLADRGFDKGPLVRWLIESGCLFLVRARSGIYVYDGPGKSARLLNPEFQIKPDHVQVLPNVFYEQKERLPVHFVVCARLDPKNGKTVHWRLITNLPEEHLPRLPKLYANRMHPEGTHRDCKRGHFVSGFALSHLGRMRMDRLERYLTIVSIAYGFLVLLAETERELRDWLCKRHWGLALATFALDLIDAAGKNARHLVSQACASVKLEPLWLQGGDS